MKRLLWIALAVVALLAAPVIADLVITITVVPLTTADVVELSIVDAGGGDLQAVLVYDMKKDTGDVYQRGQHGFVLSPAQRTAILNFLNNDAIPAANAAEGLSP